MRKISLSKSTLYNNFIYDSVKYKAQQFSMLFSHLFFLINIQMLSNLLSDMLYCTLFIMIFPVFKICIWMSLQMYIFQVCVASLSSSMYMNLLQMNYEPFFYLCFPSLHITIYPKTNAHVVSVRSLRLYLCIFKIL